MKNIQATNHIGAMPTPNGKKCENGRIVFLPNEIIIVFNQCIVKFGRSKNLTFVLRFFQYFVLMPEDIF